MEEVKKDRKFEGKKPERRERAPRREESDINKKLICVRRVNKTVKGGRTMRFSALVAVGDGKGNVGIGIGKSKEVPAAIDKATSAARKNMKYIRVVNGTIPHEITGKFSTTKILMVLELSLVDQLVLLSNLQESKILLQRFMVLQTKSTVLKQL